MSVHLEGMGVIGSILAHELREAGVDFSWSDSGRQRNAWQACTGAVYPSGDERDDYGLTAWRALRFQRAWARSCSSIHPWIFSTKRPPHGARSGWTELPYGLRELDRPSLHVNAQLLVRNARVDYDHLEGRPERGAQRIVTHGWSWRRTESVWGWTRLVQLVTDDALPQGPYRPAFYFREGRFTMAYAYPAPGTDGCWYAGSSLIVQKNEERDLDPEKHYRRWLDNFLRLANGAVLFVREAGPLVQGWRPRENERDHPDRPLIAERDGVWYVRPHWNSGVRHAPLIVDAVLERLGVPASTTSRGCSS